MAIAYQPVTAPDLIQTRPAPERIRYASRAVRRPARTWAAVRLLGLVTATAMCVALVTAIVAGTALFALLNIAG